MFPSPVIFCSGFLLDVVLRWGLRKQWPSQQSMIAAAAAAWQDSKRTLWGLKVPKASWVISHYSAVTEGSAVNTEIIWAMVNDSAVQAFGMIKDRSSCTRHLSGPWITPPASQLGEWSRENRWRGMCRHTNKHVPPLSPRHTGKWLLKVCRYRAQSGKGLLPSVAIEWHWE